MRQRRQSLRRASTLRLVDEDERKVAEVSITTLSTTPQRVPGVSDCGMPYVAALDREEAERRASMLKALADPVRLQLLSIISASPNQEACVCDMTEAVAVAQPTVSHHLKTLVDA